MDTPSQPIKAMSNLGHFLDNSSLAYHGVRFDVRACEVPAKNGQTRRHEAMVHPGAVVILPLWEDDAVVMIRNYRFAVGETLWELPAGTLEADETPQTSALRELVEETGYQAKIIEPFPPFYSSPGISNEVLYAYVAKELHFVGQKLDDTEMISTEILPWQQILSMIRCGEIRDNKTLTTLLFYWTYFKGI